MFYYNQYLQELKVNMVNQKSRKIMSKKLDELNWGKDLFINRNKFKSSKNLISYSSSIISKSARFNDLFETDKSLSSNNQTIKGNQS